MKKHRRKWILLGVMALVLVGAGVSLYSRAGPRVSSAEYIRRYNALAMEGVDPTAPSGWALVERIEGMYSAADSRLTDGFKLSPPGEPSPGSRNTWSWSDYWQPETPTSVREAISTEMRRLEEDGFFELVEELAAGGLAPVRLDEHANPFTDVTGLLERYSPLQRAMTIEMVRFAMALENGEPADAADSIRDAGRLIELRAEQPLVLGRVPRSAPRPRGPAGAGTNVRGRTAARSRDCE